MIGLDITGKTAAIPGWQHSNRGRRDPVMTQAAQQPTANGIDPVRVIVWYDYI